MPENDTSVIIQGVEMDGDATDSFLPQQSWEEWNSIDGAVYMASSQQIEAGSGETIRFLLENNSTDKTIRVFRLVTTLDSGPLWARMFINPDTNLPTTERAISNANIASSSTSDARLLADSGSAMSGGTDTGIEFGLPTGERAKDVMISIPPQTSVGVNIPLGALSSGSGSATATFVEK